MNFNFERVKLIAFVAAILATVCIGQTARACSALLMSSKTDTLVARNFDWSFGHGLVIVNKRGVSKKALVKKTEIPAEWTSKYGSITFNQVSRELPQGGMNEKGLVVESLWLDSASFPQPDQRPITNELQWIQFQLDNFSTTAEVISNLEKLRPSKSFASIHYFVCDAPGACATIEPVAGKLVVHSGSDLPVPALANDSYADSSAYAAPFLKNSDCEKIPAGNKSLNRFARAACFLKNSNRVGSPKSADAAFQILEQIAQQGYTKWSIVYNLTERMVTFRSADAKSKKEVQLSALNFSCSKPAQILDINTMKSGEVNDAFADYTLQANRSIVESSLLKGFANMPREVIEALSNYPNSGVCKI
jgi:penicillin V acylase-like amidase (Ntn superfamily)